MPPYLDAANSMSKISLSKNLNCEGAFGGGTITVNFINSSTYKSTFSGCKFPFIKLATSGITISEDPNSTQDIILQGLDTKLGIFLPPVSRQLIFKTTALTTGTIIADLSTGFNPGSSIIRFEVADSGKNYKIKLPNLSTLIFSNPNNMSAFYDLQNDVYTDFFSLEGPSPIPLRGLGKTISTLQFSFDAGIVTDTNRLSKVSLDVGGSSNSYIGTSNVINIPNIELNKNISLLGNSNIFNFSGTTFILKNFNLNIGAAHLSYYTKTTTGGTIATVGGSITDLQ